MRRNYVGRDKSENWIVYDFHAKWFSSKDFPRNKRKLCENDDYMQMLQEMMIEKNHFSFFLSEIQQNQLQSLKLKKRTE